MRILRKWIARFVILFCGTQIEVFAGQMDIPEGTDLQGNTGFPGDVYFCDDASRRAICSSDGRKDLRTGGTNGERRCKLRVPI